MADNQMNWRRLLRRALGRYWGPVTLGPRLWTMGASVRHSVRLCMAGVTLTFRPQAFVQRRFEVNVKLEGQRFPVVLADRSDFFVLAGLRTREFALELEVTPRVIVDLGAHIGLSSLFFRASYPEARIYALEANPLTFEQLRANVADAGVETLRGAVAGEAGELEFFLGDASWESSLNASVGGSQVRVKAWTLNGLLDHWQIDHVDILKLDIEGTEFEVLRSADALSRVSAIVAELHYDLADGTESEMRETLVDYDVHMGGQPHPHRALLHAYRRNEPSNSVMA
jgi:FkbM family methyltransferase